MPYKDIGKQLAYWRNYRKTKAKEIAERAKQWRARHKKKISAYGRVYREKNKEQLAAYKRVWNVKHPRTKEYEAQRRAVRREEINEANRRWWMRNKRALRRQAKARGKGMRAELRDHYVAYTLGCKTANLPRVLIEAKRTHLMGIRALRRNTQ